MIMKSGKKAGKGLRMVKDVCVCVSVWRQVGGQEDSVCDPISCVCVSPGVDPAALQGQLFDLWSRKELEAVRCCCNSTLP